MRTLNARTLILGTLALVVAGCATESGGGGGGSAVAIAKANPSGDGQTATVATAVASALRVVVTENGTPVAGRTVAWATPGGGSVSTSSTTDASGIASTQWTLGQAAGNQTATATLSGASGSPVGFSATATAGPAAAIAKTGGDGQTGVVGTPLANPLQATASDQFGNPVSGISVMWQVTAGMATVNPPSSSTSGSGQAETVVTLGSGAGAITIQAVSTGLSGSPLSFMATAQALPTMVTVQVTNNTFQPANVTIAAGGTVTWNWGAAATDTHNVSPDGSEPVRSGNPVPGPTTYQFTFNTPGTYTYYCEVHGGPGLFGMSGTITVQ